MDTSHFTSRFKELKHRSHLDELYRTLSPERVLTLWLLASLSVILLFSAMVAYNSRFLMTVPAYGGTIREGIVGTPRFINPVLAVSEPDQDLTNLVYAGLTKRDASGNTIYDMASSIVESDDNLHYDVTIRPDARFQDGKKVTADDVIYTISLIQDQSIKSPHSIEFEGVTMEKVSSSELVFTLKKPYPLFMNTLSIGILPKHLWKNLTDDQFGFSNYNINAIGSGPYAIQSVSSSNGVPDTFTLVANKHYTLGRPYIDTIIISTYPNEKYELQALNSGDIDRVHGIAPETIQTLGVSAQNIHTSLLPRTFTIFFNSSNANPLAEQKVRQALQMAIDKDAIVKTVLHGYGKPTNTPYPFDEGSDATSTYNPEEAKALLQASKSWQKSKSMTLTISTANTDEMKKVAQMVQADWEAIGVTTNLAVYEVSDLNQSVIKNRDFQVLLFGSIVETPADLYAFWDSTQRNYPGLNISNYVSKTLDQNLDTLRNNPDPAARDEAYQAVRQEFADQVPGIFLFTPSLIYVTKDKATAALPAYSLDNSSRFDLVQSWYRYSEKVWPKTYYKQLVELTENIIH